MDVLEREAEYKRPIMPKELTEAKAEEETMRKLKEEERQEEFTPVAKYETPSYYTKKNLVKQNHCMLTES